MYSDHHDDAADGDDDDDDYDDDNDDNDDDEDDDEQEMWGLFQTSSLISLHQLAGAYIASDPNGRSKRRSNKGSYMTQLLQ